MGSESQTAESMAESNNDSIESSASINANKWSIEPIDSRTFKLFSESKRKLTSHKSCNNDSTKTRSANDTIEKSTNKTDDQKNGNIDENPVKRRKECSFESLGVPNWLIEISDSLQIKKPTRIQQMCLPSAFAGKNLIGCSETGSGKTICFCWPILVAFAKNPYGVFSLILTPTRELALQISDQFRVFGANLNVNILPCVGGFDIIKQSTEMERRPHVVVATPGRLAYQVSIPERNLAKIFANVKYLVLDECDRLLDKNFEENLGVILKCVPSSSEGRITFMFSATITPSIQYLTTSLSAKKEVGGSSCKDESNANEDGDSEGEAKYSSFELFDATESNCQRLQNNIQHEYIFLPQHVHMTYLVHVLNKLYDIDTSTDSTFGNGANGKPNHKKNDTNSKGTKKINLINGASSADKKGIIFVSTKKRCDLVYLTLEQLKFKVTSINSNMKQIKRNDNLSKFRSGHSNILVATDLVSRGIDVPEVEFIINLDFPSTVFDYIHRIGRTGRAGRSGIAISFIDEYDRDKVKNVESSTNIRLEKYQINDMEAVKLLNKVTVATQRAYLFLQQNEKSVNLDFRNKGLFLKDIFKYGRNPEKNGEIEKLKVDEESNKNKFNSSNLEPRGKESQLKDELSRVELVFGSSGLKLLNQSNVLVLGANELSSKIITHLIRSGVSSVTLWDSDKNLAEDKLTEIRILNPDCNIKSIHTDPEEYIKGGDYSTIIFANRPITEAIKYNNIFHGKCNFVYAFVAGTYGLVINDFGKHEIRVKSDHSHQEHTCKLVYSGKESCLEATGSDLYNYKRNDSIQVKYTQQDNKSKVRTKNKSGKNDRSVVIDTFKIVNVDRTDKSCARIWIKTGSRRLPKNIVSVKKVDEVIELNFGTIEDLLSKLLETRKLKALVRSIYDRVFNNRVIDKLVISPSCSNNLNNGSLSVLSSLIALNRANLYNLKGDLDSRNFYDLTKQVYSMSNYETVCNFNELKDLKIPAMTTLIGNK
ncbi:ATP-dependent RNA helicase [Theileria orientalis]|uniref:ATP-dependent RNA helicase n=1 Tax=Theileria orientalis TaxID=68886 RepID=A0A976QSB2_THEOR|nr:ATP-dependent RNA helicase [Theileria orientalis]